MSLPTKRSASATTSNSSSSASASASANFHPMKKAKSQVVSACSPLDPPSNKNGLHHFNPTTASESDVVFDPSALTLDDDPKLDDPTKPPAAANLSRKKAIPPQPAKKLVIKLVKGIIIVFFPP